MQFDEPIEFATFTQEDLHFFRNLDDGSELGVFVPISPTVFGIFPTAPDGRSFRILVGLYPGSYRVWIGPNINDLAGNLMNQDGDGVNGEAIADAYIEGFTVRVPYAIDVVGLSSPELQQLLFLSPTFQFGIDTSTEPLVRQLILSPEVSGISTSPEPLLGVGTSPVDSGIGTSTGLNLDTSGGDNSLDDFLLALDQVFAIDQF